MAPTESSSPLPLPNYLQENNLTQNCKDLLPTLPSEENLVGSRIHLYHGFWFPTNHLNGILSCRNNFHARHDDVILATMPKSGTTWLMAILFALSHRASPSTGEGSSQRPSPLLTTSPHELVPSLELNIFMENENPDMSSFTSPRIFATHIPSVLLPQSIRDSDCKIVYLCRNIKDHFASFWHFVNKLRPKGMYEIPLEEVFDRFCRGAVAFGPCWDHVLGYWKASLEMPERVLFLMYEDIKERPIENVKRLADFIGCPFHKGEDEDEAAKEIMRMCSFESLSKLEVNKKGKLLNGLECNAFFRKGQVGDWANLLSSEMVDRLDRITEEKLRGTTLKL